MIVTGIITGILIRIRPHPPSPSPLGEGAALLIFDKHLFFHFII
jgi:hypothetical protein